MRTVTPGFSVAAGDAAGGCGRAVAVGAAAVGMVAIGGSAGAAGFERGFVAGFGLGFGAFVVLGAVGFFAIGIASGYSSSL
jgi:hypothetical protein